MTKTMCPRCEQRPKVPGQGYCRQCRRDYQRNRYRDQVGASKVDVDEATRDELLDIDAIIDQRTGQQVRCGTCITTFSDNPLLGVLRSETFPLLCTPCYNTIIGTKGQLEIIQRWYLIAKDSHEQLFPPTSPFEEHLAEYQQNQKLFDN